MDQPVVDPHFDQAAAGPPQVAPHFGTEFWKADRAEVDRLVARCTTEPTEGSLAAEAANALRLPDAWQGDENIFSA